MKKYVLNIEKLYTGQTGNALVLNQVDCDFPVLIPFVDDSIGDLGSWINKWQSIYDFNPPSYNTDELNDYIMDFNLNLQDQFKKTGHQELYMMDDTKYIKPDTRIYHTDKTYMHSLNGKTNDNVNHSQMNVIFPFKKNMQKSLFMRTVGILRDTDIDDFFEESNLITLYGNVSYQKCIQSTTFVGGNLYTLSSMVDIADYNSISNNSMVLLQKSGNTRYIPSTMSLYQPSGKQMNWSTIKEYIKWYQTHNRKTRIIQNDIYGTSITNIDVGCYGSYQMYLATYSPTNLLMFQMNNDNQFGDEPSQNIRLDQPTLRNCRLQGQYESKTGTYIFDNGDNNSVGFMFNLYDTFISGKERTLRIRCPKQTDFNKMFVCFEVGVKIDSHLGGEFTPRVYINSLKQIDLKKNSDTGNYDITTVCEPLNSTLDSYTYIDVTVIIDYEVDFKRRDLNTLYTESLVNSGVYIRGIDIDSSIDKLHDMDKHLTFWNYVNQSEDESESRYEQIFQISRYINDISYQTIIESSLRNIQTNGIKYLNNYSTGDMYGDAFVTKSALNPVYDMQLIQVDVNDDAIVSYGRDYIGLSSCSDQLSLIFNRAETICDERGTHTRRYEDQLKYQLVEVVKNINKFESSIKHKSNVFSVVVENSNLSQNDTGTQDELEKYKELLRNSVIQFVRSTCSNIVPVHTQLFDVQFT